MGELLPIVLTTQKVDAPSPPPYLSPDFVKELNRIGGYSPCGRFPIYRVVWGGSEQHFALGEMRLKYPKSWKTVPVAWAVIRDGKEVLLPLEESTKTHDEKGQPIIGRPVYEKRVVGVQSWFLEQWMPPEIACIGWEALRYKYDMAKGVRIDVLGPAPRDGVYKALIKLQDNTGKILQPGPETLEWVKKVIWLKNQEPWSHNLNELPPQHIVERRLRMALAEQEFQEEKRANEFGDELGSVLWEHKDKFIFNDPTIPTPHSGNFFVPAAKQEKGLIVNG